VSAAREYRATDLLRDRADARLGGMVTLRAVVHLVLILAGEAAALATLSLALAWVPFLLVWPSYRYVSWRLTRLQPPWPEQLAGTG
jgi:hypothetical protein